MEIIRRVSQDFGDAIKACIQIRRQEEEGSQGFESASSQSSTKSLSIDESGDKNKGKLMLAYVKSCSHLV